MIEQALWGRISSWREKQQALFIDKTATTDMRQKVKRHFEKNIRPLLEESRVLKFKLISISQIFTDNFGLTPSASRLTAQYVKTQADDFLEQSNVIKEINPELGICLFDVASGIKLAATCIDLAEEMQRGTLDHYLARLLAQNVSGRGLIYHLDQYLIYQAYARHLAEIRKTQPDGTNLLQDFTARLRKYKTDHNHTSPDGVIPDLPSYQLLPLILVGAQYAQKIYKEVYPVAKDLL